ncbi:hypothetical protein IG631_08189 [Alternaria alternata]|nr:hypothetical protein IG631_08189 [Alternaria alternata]
MVLRANSGLLPPDLLISCYTFKRFGRHVMHRWIAPSMWTNDRWPTKVQLVSQWPSKCRDGMFLSDGIIGTSSLILCIDTSV